MLTNGPITLRQFLKDDTKFFLKWFNDSDILKFLSLYLPISEIEEDVWLQKFIMERKGTDILFVISLTTGEDNKRAIGTCGIHKIDHKNRCAEITMVIGEKDQQDKGYGTLATEMIISYCFKELNLHRISTGAFAFNTRSINVLQKIGFKREGRQRQAIFKNGRYEDIILLGLLFNSKFLL